MKCLVDGCKEAGVTHGCCWDHKGRSLSLERLAVIVDDPTLRVYRCNAEMSTCCAVCRIPIAPGDRKTALYTEENINPSITLCEPCDKQHVKGQAA
jgi:hypothetical protein